MTTASVKLSGDNSLKAEQLSHLSKQLRVLCWLFGTDESSRPDVNAPHICPCQVLMAEEADEDPAAAAASQAAAAASAATAFEKPQGGGTGTLLASQLAAQLAPWREGAGANAAAASLRIVRNPDLRGAAPMFVQPAPRAKAASANANGTSSTQTQPGAAFGSASAGRAPPAGGNQRLPAPAPGEKALVTADSSVRTASQGQPGPQTGPPKPQPPQPVPAPDRSTVQTEAGPNAGADSRRERRRGNGRTRGRRPAGGGGSSASASPAVSRASSPGPAQRVRLMLVEPPSHCRGHTLSPPSPRVLRFLYGCCTCHAYIACRRASAGQVLQHIHGLSCDFADHNGCRIPQAGGSQTNVLVVPRPDAGDGRNASAGASQPRAGGDHANGAADPPAAAQTQNSAASRAQRGGRAGGRQAGSGRGDTVRDTAAAAHVLFSLHPANNTAMCTSMQALLPFHSQLTGSTLRRAI